MKQKMYNQFIITFVLLTVLILNITACNNNTKNKVINPPQNTKKPQALSTDSIKSQNTNNDKVIINNADKKRVKAKGLYLTGTSAGAKLQKYIDIAKTTGINTYVIDYKDDGEDAGNINIKVDSNVPLAKEIKATTKEYDAKKVVAALHDNGIYAIARIVCFKDPMIAKKKPQYAIKNKNGSLFIHNRLPWVSAYCKDIWQYNVDLAKEALEFGFDEVQFDYIRFPDLTKKQNENLVFPENNGKTKIETINAFLEFARKELPNAVLSADIFAIVIESISDGKAIGQEFETVGKHMDYICPMAYPSHYANGQVINNVAFKSPDLDPYGIIKQTLLKAKNRLSKVEGHKPIIRTYIQDFTASWVRPHQNYGAKQVSQQIKAIQDAGYEEFLLWDPMNTYHTDAVK